MEHSITNMVMHHIELLFLFQSLIGMEHNKGVDVKKVLPHTFQSLIGMEHKQHFVVISILPPIGGGVKFNCIKITP